MICNIRVGSKTYRGIACLISTDEAGSNVIGLFPIDKVIALKTRNDLKGHPSLDLNEDEYSFVEVTPERKRSLLKAVGQGKRYCAVYYQTNQHHFRIGQVTWSSLNLSEADSNWLTVYVQFTYDYLPELREAVKAEDETGKSKGTEKPSKPKKPKISRKVRRQLEKDAKAHG